MNPTILEVDLGERSYPIYIGEQLLSNPEYFVKHIPGRQVMVVSNDVVAPLYLDKLLEALESFHVATVVLPDGEEHKNMSSMDKIYTALLENRFDRTCTLVALGGGVVGDMTGFAAASYQRGVNFVQVPTTLLSQVDSSVGGKTGVNHPLGKNMIGAFHQPLCVVADTTSLNTLPDRELSAGLAEVIKYGLINDLPFFEWLEDNMARLLNRDPEALAYAIERSCADKAGVVSADEREAGQRALLNLGHTFGHAIETGMGYGAWLHGEAVGAGMCMAAQLSLKLGRMDSGSVARVLALMEQANLPTAAPDELTAEQMLATMSVDKKVIAGSLRLVLMNGIGQSEVTANYDQRSLMDVLSGDIS